MGGDLDILKGGRGTNLVDYLGDGGILAVEACFEAVGAGGGCFLALGGVRSVFC